MGKNHTCPMPPLTEDASEPFVNNLSFYHFNMILSGACTAFACLVILSLMQMHAMRLSKPNEQLKIMKICGLIPAYAVFCFISICFPNAFVYLTPWLDVFQGIALGSFFLLMCEYVSPSDAQRDLFFAGMRVPQKNGTVGGLEWYRQKWVAIFQYPVVATVISIATMATQGAGVYCLESSKPYFAHLWLNIIMTISLIGAVLAVFRFYRLLRRDLAHHGPLGKFLAFKLIVFLTFVQRILFWILRSANALKPTSKLTYADLNIGIPTLLICLEMVPFSLFFHHAYKVSPYLLSKNSPPPAATQQNGHYYPVNGTSYQGGFLGIRAWLGALNPSEILKALSFALRMATESRRGTSYDVPT